MLTKLADLKEITVFTVGDASELSAWSNVPYFFTKSFEEKNIKVNRVNIEENVSLKILYKYSVFAVLKIFYRNSDHTYFRSGLNYFLTNLKIKSAKKKHATSDAFIFLTYSFCGKQTSSENCVLFSDWSYLYRIRNLFNRDPYWFEKKALKREKKIIESADLALSLFPGSLEFNKNNYPAANCFYLGNVINSENVINEEKLLELKSKSQSLLFIGNKKYLQGAMDLIAAFTELKKKCSLAQLHLIGLESAVTGVTGKDIFYYGYLDKGTVSENKQYYELLSSARCIVNTTQGWGAFSAMTEAMYYYTPVITSAYSEFVKTYGDKIDFGTYVNSGASAELADILEKMLSCSPEIYQRMALNSHARVKDFSWKNYTDKLLALIS
ncbi:hypothetical protein CNR22_19405 [Sphingobacteriaceae bacterium]|nr:hypothetical protein CNR22_19405 [Sphingobacteriaceae bacterium]